MKISTFSIDVTPPVGVPIAFGINEKVGSPIYIRGIIIDDSRTRIVMASADFIYICGKAYVQMKKTIAKAAGTTPGNVFLHAVHQHDSMRFFLELNPFFKKYVGRECISLSYYREVISKLEKYVRAASRKMLSVKSMATAERRISGLASNRRLLNENGKVYAMRFSLCSDPEKRKKPVGRIDPLLRSIGFIGRKNTPIAILHFYASHPIILDRRNMVSADVPGVALNYIKENPGFGKDALNIYFNGCGANITFGKYFIPPQEKSLKLLGERLGKSLQENCNHLEEKPMGPVSFKHSRFDFPLAPDIKEGKIKKQIANKENVSLSAKACIGLAVEKEWHKWKNPQISRISLGSEINIMSFPAETVVEYQLYAQSLIPEKFLACAAYGNGIYYYIPTKKMFEEGGYESTYGTITTPEIEKNMKKAIVACLSGSG